MPENPNPQGKGLVPALASLHEYKRGIPLIKKSLERLLAEYFTSVFVLSSRFKFRPKVGRAYFMYFKECSFHLSLVGPDECDEGSFGLYAGQCELQADMTWTFDLSEAAQEDKNLLAVISKKQEDFAATVEDVETIEANLPTYDDSLPFQQRALAAALSTSIKQTMAYSGLLASGPTKTPKTDTTDV